MEIAPGDQDIWYARNRRLNGKSSRKSRQSCETNSKTSCYLWLINRKQERTLLNGFLIVNNLFWKCNNDSICRTRAQVVVDQWIHGENAAAGKKLIPQASTLNLSFFAETDS
jgi:hypothetical protein